MRVLITGATGFIGSNLLSRLQDTRKMSILLSDRQSYLKPFQNII
ncbi:NAD-dependent epimerase/dehydratase family protein [Candidatus Nitrosocosmicus hydrocola]